MRRHRASGSILLGGLVVVGLFDHGNPGLLKAEGPQTVTPAPQRTAVDPAAALTQALQTNPVTAPYRFSVRPAGRQLALSGRVGSKQVHDAAIRTAIELGVSVRDDLTIDTTESYRAALRSGPVVAPTSSVYVYPPPLFGRLDDPFYGFEPPLVTYPPFAGAVAAREPINLAALNNAADPTQGALPNTVQMTLDANGVATLRGRVPTLAARVAIGQEVARVRGISQVVNLLDVGPPASGPADPDTPPPPPTPARPAAPSNPSTPPPPRPGLGAEDLSPVDRAAAPIDVDPLGRRVSEALARRPALRDAGTIQVSARDGVVTLTGRTPSAYEAMLAFRAAQQTPGVRDVVDRIEFPLPDVDQTNPLRAKARPDDLEPYLLSHVRRQLGDLAHVDQIRVRGETLEIHGTVARAGDTPRVEAALRSIPLLRGFRLESQFTAE